MTSVFNSLNSLIWLLILILVIAAIVTVVRAVLAPRAEEPYRERRVAQRPVVQQPMATSGLAPGWYPDQNDATLMRYFDGRGWTSSTEPRI
ncbi:DUF2510 domain-containing protein [Mycobacterium sp.]|jgi:hypothetical protein|uniref:DUF2510 domain-containing protein n=1 Tax=Mycobacterium sp. TaxID=1785 RepID=UPI002D64BC4B|nr:DUF2510 domain-containing protein [Mycobacterium sp.]HZA08749.1 DUF2510 domain-containing protein [Mycobacterium sp.]